MKVKAKLAAAIAMALTAGVASAAPIADDGIFFSAWDSVNQTSIVVNLNLGVDAFRANPTAAYSLSGDGLAGLQSWLSTANIGAVQWTVMGVNDDGTGPDIPPSLNYGGVTTSPNIETTYPDWGSFGGLDAAVTGVPTFLDTVNRIANVAGTGLEAANFYATTGAGAYTFSGQYTLGFESRSSVGSTVGFYNFFANPDNSFFEGGYSDLGGEWTLAFAGNQAALTYSAGAPVVPLPAAVWLLGSGLLGLVGIARRKAAAVAA